MLAWRRGRFGLPFLLQRPALLMRDLLMNRERPDLKGLESVEHPEAFVWRILPHAARTFSACIALLPARLARASAVAYLYCRCLDSYEDFLPEHAQREEALWKFAQRFREAEKGLSAPAGLNPALAGDERDRTHIILVNRCGLVDEVFLSLEPAIREVIIDLVRGMADGMTWSSRTFEKQRGVLLDADQVTRYCGYVLGLPAVFAARLLHYHYQGNPTLSAEQTRDALLVGEMVQLANITRDIEKDLRRGIAYHPSLRDALGVSAGIGKWAEAVRQVREQFLLRALALAPAYRRFVDGLHFPRFSFGRASAILMLLFTERYYRGCARQVGREVWAGSRSGSVVLLRSLPAAFSRRWAGRVMEQTERHFLEHIQRGVVSCQLPVVSSHPPESGAQDPGPEADPKNAF